MTEAQWLSATDPRAMLEYLRGKASERKLRLFAVACCRSVWESLSDLHRQAIGVAERHIDVKVTDVELGRAVSAVHRDRGRRDDCAWAVYEAVRTTRGVPYQFAGSVSDRVARVVARGAAPNPNPTALRYHDGTQWVTKEYPPNADRLIWKATRAAQQQIQTAILRCISGNPFRPITAEPAWRSEPAVLLATGIYTDRAFDRMSVLADALQEAGCDHADILNHCRGDGPHVRGCWVVDLILGKV